MYYNISVCRSCGIIENNEIILEISTEMIYIKYGGDRMTFKRVNINEEYYVDIMPSATDENVTDFWLHSRGYCYSVFMFGFITETIKNAENIAIKNAPFYMQELIDLNTK